MTEAKPDALLLCGGYGTRLAPISYFIPKALLPLPDGKPLLTHIVEDIKDYVDRFIIATNLRFAAQFLYWKEHAELKDIADKIYFVIEPTTSDENKFGIVKAVANAINEAKVEGKPLLVLSTDEVREFSLKPFLDYFNEAGKPIVLLRDLSEYGIPPGSAMKLVDFIRINSQLEASRSRSLTCGVVAIPAGIVPKVVEYASITENKDSFTSFLRPLNEADLELRTASGRCFDIGTIEAYKAVFDEGLEKAILELKQLRREDENKKPIKIG